MTNLASVQVLSLGGTIAMVSGGHGTQLDGAQLLAAVPGLDAVAEVGAATAARLPGASLGFSHLLDVLARARAAVDCGAAGVVVTQGTDTIEETAYFWDLMWDRPEPLVVTGAMRLAGAPGADGPANLLAAVAVAVEPRSRDRGVLVVFGDEVHAPRHVAKGHSARIDAFGSPGAGPVGGVLEGVVRFWSAPRERLEPMVLPDAEAPAVRLVPALLGDDGTGLAAATAESSGVVLAAMGAGHVPAPMLDQVATAVAAVPVALCSRTGAGPVLHHTYDFPGCERDLHRLGLLDAADLAPLKARILLILALWSGRDRAEQEEAFLRRAAG